MKRSGRNNSTIIALWANAVLLFGILIVLLARRDGSMLPSARADIPAIGGGNGVFVMPAQFSTNTWGCYLLDVDSHSLCAYSYFPGEKQLRLVAVREYRYDRLLKEFNTSQPTPREVKAWVEKQNQAGEAGPAPVSPSEPAKENPNP